MFESRSIGIDIRSNSVKIAVATVQGGHIKLLDLIEKQIPEAPPAETAKLSAAIIREAFVENELNGDSCVASLPAAATVNRLLVSPISDLAKIRQTLKFQLEPQIPYPVDQVISDFIPIRKTAEGTELLAMAVTKGMLSERLEIFKNAGIDPQIITLDVLALADFYINPFDFSGDKITMLLRLNYDYSFLGFFLGNKLVGYRNLDGMAAPDDQNAEQKMLKEIQRSLLAHEASENRQGEVGVICVAGPNAERFKGLLQERFSELPIRIAAFNENAVVEIPPYLLSASEECHLAIALAHLGLKNDRHQPNFRREEYAPASLFSRLKPNIYFSLCVLGVALVAWFASLTFSNRYHERQVNLLKQQMIKMFSDSLPTVKSPEDVQQKIREEQEKFKLLKSYSADYVPPLDVVAEVTAAISQGKMVTLSDFAISDSTLRMTGEADSFDDINLFRDNLDSSVLLTESKIESANKAEKSNKITFRIKARVGRKNAAQPAVPTGNNA